MKNLPPQQIPSRIQDKIDDLKDEITQILDSAYSFQKTFISGRTSFSFRFVGGRDILTDFERAQSICFVSKYESLPKFKKIKIAKINGNFIFENLWEARSVLNEYRPIIQNKKDSVYYGKVHKVCREKLLNTDSAKDLTRVKHLQDGDITTKFSIFLCSNSLLISETKWVNSNFVSFPS